MDNFILKNDYKKKNKYTNSYNSIIENFSVCSSNSTLSDADAATFLIYKSDPSSSTFDSYYENTTLSGTTQTVSNISHFLSIEASTWNDFLDTLNNCSNVSSDVINAYKGTIASTVEEHRTSPSNDYVVYNNAVKDSVLSLMTTQADTWKQINISQGDTDYQNKLNNFMVEQAALKEGQDHKNPYNKGVSQYKTDTDVFYNNLRINSRNQYVKRVQDNIIQKGREKDKMVTADIMTKGREVQLNRVSYLQRKRKNQYLRISVFTLGLCIIVIAIAQMVPESNKMIVGIVVGVILLLGLILIIGKLIRDSKRYSLDYDEVNYAPYKKPASQNSCNT